MMSDIRRRLRLPFLAATLQNNKSAKVRFGSIYPGRFSFPPTEIKLLLALAIGAALLFALGSSAISSILHLKRNFEMIHATATFVSDVQRVRGMVDDLELLEQRYGVFGDDHDLRPSEIIREQLNLSLQRLEQQPYGGSLRARLVPRLNVQTRAEHAALVERNRSRRNLATNPAFAVAPTQSNKPALAALRGRVTELYDAEKLGLDQQVDQQAEWHRELMTVSAVIAVTAAALFLYVCSLIWRQLAANRRPRSGMFDLSLDTATQSPASSSPAAADVTPIVEAARAEERASIARDIHDELGALLMAIKIDLKCSSKTTTTLRRAVDSQWPLMLNRVDAAMNAVVRIAGGLRPILVDQIGLWPAIESYVREFAEVTKIPCNLQIDVSNLLMQGEVAHEIFRIFQESLTNVARHAEASKVDIGISFEHGQLQVEIADDGAGISPDQILDLHSLGVAGMFERARRFGGELHIAARPQGGTKVTLRMPAPTLQ